VSAAQDARHDPSSAIAVGVADISGLAPERAAIWTEVAGRVVIERPRPTGHGVEGLLKRLRFLWTAKRLRLDALGSFAWKHLDGSRTVSEITEAMRREFGETAEPADERVELFLDLLYREELMVFRAPGDSPRGD
jgi:hypothetical protein